MASVTLSLTLTIAGVSGASSLSCRAMSGREAISEPFRFEISFMAGQKTVSEAESGIALGKAALLTLKASDGTATQEVSFAGVVLEFRIDDVTTTKDSGASDTLPCTVVLGPKLALLDYSQQSAIVINKEDTSRKFFEKLLGSSSDGSTTGGHQLTLNYQVSDSVDADENLPIAASLTKYNETDFTFFSRVIEHYGVFYYSTVTDKGEDLLKIGCKNSDFPEFASDVTYRNDPVSETDLVSPCVRSFSRVQRAHFGSVMMRDYNEDKADVVLLSSKAVDDAGGVGARVEHGDHFASVEEGASLAAIRAEELAWQAKTFEGESTVAGLRAGMKIKLTADSAVYPTRFAGEYLIVSVEHSAAIENVFDQQRNLVTNQAYGNRFVAIPFATAFRPRRRTPRPVMAGVFSGVVAGDGTRAQLDKDGKYSVTMQFDEGGGHKMGTARSGSPPVRKMGPYANSGTGSVVSGIHLPLVPQTEVLVAYVNGHPDRPVILGAAANSVKSNVVNDKSPTLNRLRTTAGTLLEMTAGLEDAGAPFLRLDVPCAPTEGPTTGTYFRMGKGPEDEGKPPVIITGLKYTQSSVKKESAYDATAGGMKNLSELTNFKGISQTAEVIETKGPYSGSGEGFQFYTADDLDQNIAGAGLMMFGKGSSVEVTTGDSQHAVPAGQYLSEAQSLTFEAIENSDINIIAKNEINTIIGGESVDIIYGYLKKNIEGDSYSELRGSEETIKLSLSITLMLSASLTTTLGAASTLTLGPKVDFIVNSSRKNAIGGDFKVVQSDKKILVTGDFKMAVSDSKILFSNEDKKIGQDCSVQLSHWDSALIESLKSNLERVAKSFAANAEADVSNLKVDVELERIKKLSLWL